jgi:hypothetical protein
LYHWRSGPGGSPDGTLRQIEIQVSAVRVHPGWAGDTNDNLNDIAVVTLENVAPFGASYYEIYTTGDQAAVTPEVGQPYVVAGYGETGNGTMGQFATARGELQRLRVNAAGTYTLGLDGVFTAPIAFNANAAAIEAALPVGAAGAVGYSQPCSFCRWAMPRLAITLLALAIAAFSLSPLGRSSDLDPEPPKTTLKAYPKDEEAVEELFRMALDRKPSAEEAKKVDAAVHAKGKGAREARPTRTSTGC